MSDSHAHGHDVEKAIKRYLRIGAILIVLTGVTVMVSRFSFGIGLGVGVALLIATAKGSLVGAYFMHLVDEKPIIYWVLLLAFVFFLVLLLIPTYWAMHAVQ